MTSSQQDALLREASALKMRAMRLRTFGDADDQRQAVTLLRHAAQKEITALEAQKSASPDTEARARIEACGLFLEGDDPVRAAEQWALLPQWVFFSKAGAAMLERLKPTYDEKIAKFTEAWRDLSPSSTAPPEPQRVKAKSISSLLDSYAGVAELWWALSVSSSDPAETSAARSRAIELEPSLADETSAKRAWARIHRVLLRTIKIKMSAERRGERLGLDSVSRIADRFGDLLSSFVDSTLNIPVELVPSAATSGSFILDVTAQGLPPHALEALNEILTRAPEQADAGVLRQLLALLQQNRVCLTVSLASSEEGGESPAPIHIDAKRRKPMIDAAEAAALRTIDSRDVPQANELDRVFRIVEMVANREALEAETLEISQRQVAYYRRAAKILNFMSESDELTAAGKQIARLGAEDRLRATVVHFEASVCGNAWIHWSAGKTLRDVQPERATEFLSACVPGLSAETAERRAQTLIAWHRALVEYHYTLA